MNPNPAVEIRYAYNFRPTAHRPTRPHLHPKLRRFLLAESGSSNGGDDEADSFHRLMRELISEQRRPPTRSVIPFGEGGNSGGADAPGSGLGPGINNMVAAERLEIVALAAGLAFLVLLLAFILWSTLIKNAALSIGQQKKTMVAMTATTAGAITASWRADAAAQKADTAAMETNAAACSELRKHIVQETTASITTPPLLRRSSTFGSLVDDDGMRKRANSVMKTHPVEESSPDYESA